MGRISGEFTETEYKNESFNAICVWDGVSLLEMTFCDIHTCDLGKGLVKVRDLSVPIICPAAGALLLETG